ncbi:MAG: alanine racemase [Synergistaceae bacterium]|nr:alanine racemase [Synergistaceae bacterium]
MGYESPTRMEVFLENVRHNWGEVRKLVGPDREIYAVIKADAYGHGAVKLARVCRDAGCKNFAVARVDEAIELREAGITESILVLGQASLDSADTTLRHDITCACAEMAYARELSRAAVASGKKGKIHVKINSGMNRLGFRPKDFERSVDALFSLPGLDIDGIFTHFAVADETRPDYTDMQFGQFSQALDLLKKKGLKVRVRHACNSAAVLTHPDKYLDAVRPGIMLYGVCPLPVMPEGVHLRPAFAFKSAVASIHDTDPGSGVGYGLRYVTRGKERTAVVPVGYGDGWTRTLSMKTGVLIRGRRCPVVGTICMDQLMVDVTDLDRVELGDEVVLLGKQGDESITVEEIAALRETIPHEISIALLKRVRRVYI